MTFDPHLSTHHMAAAASAAEHQESFTGGDDNVTDQYLLQLIRFVQYGMRQTRLSPVERILLHSARDVFGQLADECAAHAHAHERGTLPMASAVALSDAVALEPLPGEFLDPSLTEWPEPKESEATGAKKTSPKKKSSKTAPTRKKRRARKPSRSDN